MEVFHTTPSLTEAIHKAVWMQRLISSFLLVETFAITGVGWYLSGQALVETQPLPLLAALGLVCVAIPFLVPTLARQILDKAIAQQQPETPEAMLKICQAVVIVMMALRVMPGVLSLPLMLLSGEPLWGCAATALAVVVALQHWPDQEWFNGFVNAQLRRLRTED